jgi:antitoxin PrlF
MALDFARKFCALSNKETLDSYSLMVYNNQYNLIIQNILIKIISGVIQMLEKDTDESCCIAPESERRSCCIVEAVISVDDRGQMVLPKEIRNKAEIHAGDKLAVISWEKDGEVCCISLIKVDALTDMVKGVLGPVMREIM